MSFGADGTLLIVPVNNQLVILRTQDGNAVAQMAADTNQIAHTAASDRPLRIVAMDENRTILFEGADLLRDHALTLERVRVLDTPGGTCCAIPQDGHYTIIGNSAGMIQVRAWDSDEIIEDLAHRHSVVALDCSQDGSTVFSIDFVAGYVWNIRQPRTSSSRNSNSFLAAGQCSVDSVGSHAAFSDQEGSIRLWNSSLGSFTVLPVHYTGRPRICLLSPNGKSLVTADDRPEIRVVDVPEGRVLATLRGHTDVVNWAQFSPDGALLLSASRDRTLCLWSASTWQPVSQLVGHDAAWRIACSLGTGIMQSLWIQRARSGSGALPADNLPVDSMCHLDLQSNSSLQSMGAAFSSR